jgi:peptidoglycan glycosyltransferase
LDLELQVRLARALEAAPGAAVLLETNSGRILALASSPSYDPNQLAEQWQELLTSQESPLLNRATHGRYQPGLALAPLLYAWGLSTGTVSADSAAEDLSRPLELEGLTLTCSVPPEPKAAQTQVAALRLGCPAPIADLAARLEAQGFQDMITAFGLDVAPDIRLEVGSPSSAAAPADPAALREAGVGQGELLLSPLQMARAFAALAGAGLRPGLVLVEAVRAQGQPWELLPALEAADQAISPGAAQRTLEALRVSSGGVVSYQALAYTGAPGEAIAWYVGLRVAGGPRRVVAVVLEDGDLDRAAAIGEIGLLAP